MAQAADDSLDRFVRNRGVAIVDPGPRRGGRRRFLSTGAVIQGVLGACGIAVLAILGPTDTGLAFGIPAAFCLFNTVLYASLSYGMGREGLEATAPEVNLTADAAALVGRMIVHLDNWPWRGERHCRDILSGAAAALLEEASKQYNRIQASLLADGSSTTPGLARLSPSIRAAADETMAELLHAAALLDRYPEAAAAASAPDARIETLRRLADQVDAARAAGTGLSTAGSVPRITEVLDQLEQQQAALKELAVSDASHPPIEEARTLRVSV